MKIDKSEIIKGFAHAFIWAETYGEDSTPIDENYTIDDITEDSMKIVAYIVDKFIVDSKLETLDILADNRQIGHDLHLTINGHGAGFWDRPKLYPDGLSDSLEKIVKDYPHTYGYITDGTNEVEIDGWQLEILK